MTGSVPFTPRPSRLVDSVLGLAMALAVVLAILGNVGEPTEVHPLAYVFAAGFGVLVALRRRATRTMLVCTVVGIFAYYAFDFPPIGMALPAVAALYSAAELGLLRWAIGSAVVLLAVSAYFRIRDGQPASYLFGYDLLTNVALAAAAIALGVAVRLTREARAATEEVRRLGEVERTLEAERRLQEERVRISRDLHDSVGHHLTVAAMHAGVAGEAVREDPEAAEASLEHVRTAIAQSLRELRETVRVLRDESATESDVIARSTLADLVAQLEAARIEVDEEIDLEGVHGPAANGAYRIVQEAVTNILRHASATRVRIRVTHDGRAVHVRVDDDGRGASASELDIGSGLTVMRERVRLLNGTLDLAAVDGGGVSVRAELPYGGEFG